MALITDKEAFLNKIAQRLGRPTPAEVNCPVWNQHLGNHLHKGLTQSELVDQFEQEFTRLTGEVHRIPTLGALPDTLTNWLKKKKIQRLVSWQHPSEVGYMLAECVMSVPELKTTLWSQHAEREAMITAAEQAELGGVVAEWGLAETGSIVLYNRGDQGRLVSLLPPVCAVILRGSKIVPRLTQVLSRIKAVWQDYSCINLITGPSQSGDIEMELSIGVHGPGHIVLFLIEDHLS